MSGDSSIGIGIGLALKSYGRAFRGLLDKYTGAAAAYSLRKLSSSTSNVVRVRRSSDDAEQDFTAAEVSGGGLVNFANNGTSALYGERMYFDGVNDSVSLPTSLTSQLDGSNRIDLSATITISEYPSAVNSGVVFFPVDSTALTGATIVLKTDGKIRVGGRSISSDSFQFGDSLSAIGYGTKTIDAYIDYANEEIGIRLNGGSYETTSVTFGTTSYTAGTPDNSAGIGDVIPATDSEFNGIISDVTISKDSTVIASYQGYGNTDADWEDQIGSNDGTVNGLPALYSGQGFDGFVATWYDQSGNGNDAVQATTTAQPQIVASGALVAGGLDFDGVDDRLTCPSLYSSDISIFNVATTSNTVNTGNYMRMIHLCDGDDSFQLTRGGGIDLGKLTSRNTAFQSGVIAFKHGDINGINLISAITSSTDTDAYIDGSLQSNGSTDLGSGNNTTTTIGARDDLLSSTFFAGSHAEIIIYNSDQSATRTAIEDNINAHYSIYP